ncbi:MAG: hypothetical protein RJA70_1639, partial [Pseudomonadota bacterium]
MGWKPGARVWKCGLAALVTSAASACAVPVAPNSTPAIGERAPRAAGALDPTEPSGTLLPVPQLHSAREAPESTPEVLTSHRFERVLDVPVRSLALAREPLIAVLSGSPWMHDKTGWHERPLPRLLQKDDEQDERLQVFFGRDFQPRIMGARWPAGRAAEVHAHEAVYLRWKQGRWQTEPSELGQLSRSRGGLYGILGILDPEIVCRPTVSCIVKRTSGWQQVAADPQASWMTWSSGEVLKVSDLHVLRLGGAGWEVV